MLPECLISCRRPARIAPTAVIEPILLNGAPGARVLLEDQDRNRWDHGRIAEPIGQSASDKTDADRRAGVSDVVNRDKTELPLFGQGRDEIAGCRQTEAEQQRQPHGHFRVGGKVEVQLEGVGEPPHPYV